MTSRRQIVWVNLSVLGILLVGSLGIYAMMQGEIGARFWASRLGTGSAADTTRACVALQSFGMRGAPAVPALLEALRNPDDAAAPACARALREIDAEAAYGNVSALVEKKPVLSPTVIDVFGNFGPIAWRAIPLVRTALDRPEHIRQLLPALIDMGDYSDEVVNAIARDASDSEYTAQKWDAMLAFDRLSDLGDRIRPELERLSADPTPAVAGQAKLILAKMANPPRYAVSGLPGFPGQSQSYQEYALDRLSKQGARAVDGLPDIVTELHSNSALIRFKAAWTLMHIGPPARSTLPQLRAALADSSTLVRDGAADAIRAIEGSP